MLSATPRAWRRLTTSQVQKIQKNQKFQDSWHVLLVEGQFKASWKWEKWLFYVTLHENVCLGSWWVRIWIGAGREPFGSEECLDQFQNIILLSWEQSLTADSLVLWSEKVPPDMLFYLWTFSAVLMRNNLHVADFSYLPWNEAYKHSLHLSSHFLLMPSLEGKPNGRHFSPKIFLNKDSVCKFVSTWFHAACMWIVVHDNLLILTWFWLSCVSWFQLQCFFPSYLFSPASK